MSPSARSTYSMIASSLALVVALLGSGMAVAGSAPELAKKLPKNSVTSKQIKNGAIQAEDVKGGALTGAQVADGSLAGSDLAGDTLTGAQVNESSLGKVPSAAAVDTVQHFSVSPPLNSPQVVTSRGPLTLKAACTGPVGTLQAEVLLSTATDNSSWKSATTGDSDVDVADGNTIVMSDNVSPGSTFGEALLRAADGTGLIVIAELVGQTSTCRLDITVVG
jgi:hypothetical protein